MEMTFDEAVASGRLKDLKPPEVHRQECAEARRKFEENFPACDTCLGIEVDED